MTAAATPWARFDDLRTGTALRFPTPHRVLTAPTAADVPAVLEEVEQATAAGQWAYGYLAYEAAAGLDPSLPVVASAGDGPPLAWFGLCAPPEQVSPVAAPAAPTRSVHWAADWSDAEYAAAVTLVRERIAAGDTYQCNLTDRLRSRDAGDPAALYAGLAHAQRAGYNAYLDLGRFVVVGASPELFFEWSGDLLRTRPMKGTAARGRSTAEDREQAERLRANPKERAENLMIVDLLRNDLARIARIGGIDVPHLFTLECYPTVWQMTSEITARIRDGVGLVEILRALFPCGSVTGAPKHRTMGLIRELEPTPRGVYCGAVGWIAPPREPVRARFAVAIRTAVLDRAAGTAVYGVGSGVTWDSDPAAERAELRTKAAVLGAPPADHGLIETLAWSPSTGFRHLPRHLARLARSADRFDFPCDPAAVRTALAHAVAGRVESARIRVLLESTGTTSVQVAALPPPARGPVRLAVDDEPVDSGSVWLAHKTTRREVFEQRAARYPHADDVVLVNERGEVTETTIANLAVRLDGVWWTPPTRSGCLPGVARGRLLDLRLLQERVLRVADLAAAEGLAVVSSLRGWRTATLIGPP